MIPRNRCVLNEPKLKRDILKTVKNVAGGPIRRKLNIDKLCSAQLRSCGEHGTILCSGSKSECPYLPIPRFNNLCWLLEMSHGGNIYVIKIGKHFTWGFTGFKIIWFNSISLVENVRWCNRNGRHSSYLYVFYD